MNARMALSLLALTANGITTAAEVTIHNNILDLAEADEKYSGFRHLQLYCNNELIPSNDKLTINTDYPYTINFVLPGNVVADHIEHSLLRMLKPLLYLILCNIKTTHTPEDTSEQNLYATEILIEKTERWKMNHPEFTMRPGGWRTLAITIHDTMETICL